MTLSLNLKKCLTLSSFFFVLGIGFAEANPPSQAQIRAALLQDLSSYSNAHFEKLLKKWESSFGTQAVSPLFQVAQDTKLEDPKRYMALMGATKLSGKASRPIVEKFSKDKSWMIRVASLRALTLIQATESADVLIHALNDPALLVRSAAVEAIQTLKIKEAKPALSRALQAKENYSKGKKPLFICAQIEKALKSL